MPCTTKGWTQKRRAKQAAQCRKNKPWDNATGPKTAVGKQVVKNNALKHGAYSEDMLNFLRLLQQQRTFIKDVQVQNQVADIMTFL
ncbi:MAG: hypothetical protein COA45_03575 [Zetaproteobacteria bacterium]|nr:MAG: hypothetical protein COA45_03575 [Zetaproteobacteria bacterium]